MISEKEKVRAKEYREKNKERIKKRMQKYSSKPETKAKRKEYLKKYLTEDIREKIKKRQSDYRLARESSYYKDYYIKNKEKLRQKNLDYRLANKTYCNQKSLKNQKARIISHRLFLKDYLSEHPCVDCGETDFLVLDFHHIRDKFMCVADMIRKGYCLQRIKDEIEKCVVVCGNCHAKRHIPPKHRRQTKKYEYVQTLKKTAKCSICGFNQTSSALQFHHIGEKIEGIARMATQAKYTVQDIILEMEKCIILCTNCHRRLHSSESIKSRF